MNYSIRELKRDENKILDTFLYEAIFIPEGVPAPSKDIINKPDLQVYVMLPINQFFHLKRHAY